LKDVKARITEYLAVRKLIVAKNDDNKKSDDKKKPRKALAVADATASDVVPDTAKASIPDTTKRISAKKLSSIICLVGPPGVGKTSVGISIARALGKQFYRFSVGGMRDEAEIKGHRRTYIGAMPGKILQGLKICKTRNPVFMIDEIDKMGASFQGDPASALLEVLDPEQNHAFRDHYLDLPFDISEIFFIVTANTLDTIPSPLLDRMEIIELPGYIDTEKLEIAKKYLLPKSLEKNGLKKSQVKYEKDALLYIANCYAREAGVRTFEKNLDKIHRKIAKDIVEKTEAPDISEEQKKEYYKNVYSIDKKLIEKYLKAPIFPLDAYKKADRPGMAVGLAWTSMGGDTLVIEAMSVGGKGGLTLTGQMGDVMKESASIAMTYAKKLSIEKYDIKEKWFEKNHIHLHIPEGATPKDGPSAGITMATCLLSLILGKVVLPNFAMTGELSLTGQVLTIGGLKEKSVAAHRNKVKHIIIPKQNMRDLEEIPDIIKNGLTYHPVERFEEVEEMIFKGE
jgi:ATP-dependent Lon protease